MGNVSNLAATSNYRAHVEGLNPKTLSIEGYPRWSEPTLGLVARVIQSARLGKDRGVNIDIVDRMTLSIAIVPGGLGTPRVLETMEMVRQGDCFDVEFTCLTSGVKKQRSVPMPGGVGSPWRLVLAAAKAILWAKARIPKAVALDVPVVRDGNLSVVRLDDIPEPARSAFAKRMAHTTRLCPLIPELGDVYYLWDWTRFLGH